MRGYRYAALGLFAAAAALAANCGFPTSGESSGGAGTGTSTTSSSSSTTTTSSSGTGGGACTSGQTQPCYTGPPGTEGKGLCKGGTQSCSDGVFGECAGEVTPQPQDCVSTVDMDCLGSPVPCSGAPVWAEAFGAADADFINAVAIDSQGNIIVTGGFSDTVNFADPAAMAQVTKTAYADNNDDIFVAKYSGDGKLMWVQAYGGPMGDEGSGVAVDASDDIVVVGRFNTSVDFGSPMTSFAGADVDAFVVKLSGADGSTLWANTYGDATALNGTTQRADAVAVDANGNVAVVGNFNNSISFGGSNTLSSSSAMDYDGYVLMLDGTGKYQWSQDVHGDPGNYPMGFDWLKGVAIDGMGNVLVTGVGTGMTMSFGTGLALMTLPPGNHVLVGKYSPMGTPLWGQALGNDPPTASLPRHRGNGITTDAAGDVVVTGSFVATLQFQMGPMLTANGATDIFVAKLDPTGSAMGNGSWSISFGGGGGNKMGGNGGDMDAANAVALDQFGNVVVAGSYQSTLAVGMPASMIKAQGMMDTFAAKLDLTGKLVWAQGFASKNGNGTGFALGVAVIPELTFVQDVSAAAPVVVGQFGTMKSDTITFGSLPVLSSAGASDMFLAHLMP